MKIITQNVYFVKRFLLSLIFLSSFSLAKAQKRTEKDNHNEDLEHEEHGHDHDNFEKMFVAVHGAVLLQSMSFLEKEERFENANGSPEEWNTSATIPMFAIAMGYKFSEHTSFLSKVEFEYGGFGGHQHLHTHGGTPHIGLEKSGAVTVERVYLTHEFSEHFKVRVGHMPVPMGQVYIAHEPTAYLSSVNAKGDTRIIPREWQETGISVLGHVTENLKYQFLCVTGLDADYFEPLNFIAEGKQNRFEKTYISSPALIGRLDYKIHELELGAVGYWGNTDKNAQDQKHVGRNVKLGLLELDTKYRTNKWHFIGDVIWGNLTNTAKLEDPVAENAFATSVELGFNLNHNESIFKSHENDFWLFGRLDYGNPMKKMPTGYESDIRTEELSFTAGINIFVNEHVALKADYEYIKVGDNSVNDEQIISLSVGYSFLPYKK